MYGNVFFEVEITVTAIFRLNTIKLDKSTHRYPRY